MKIGYLILCYKEPQILTEVVRRLLKDNENQAYIHVDAKVRQEPFESRLSGSNIHYCRERVDVHWGGFSSVVATIKLMELGLHDKCDRFVILQGLDFPLHSNNYIKEFFTINASTEFCKAYSVTKSKRPITYMKVCGYHNFDLLGKSPIFDVVLRGINLFNRVGIPYRHRWLHGENKNDRFEVYWGWGHLGLTKACVSYIVAFYRSHPRINKQFSKVFPADETYFQSIIYNSRFSKMTAHGHPEDEQTHKDVESMLNLTYFEYPNQVRIFSNLNELSHINRNKYLFVRKINSQFIETLNREGDVK